MKTGAVQVSWAPSCFLFCNHKSTNHYSFTQPTSQLTVITVDTGQYNEHVRCTQYVHVKKNAVSHTAMSVCDCWCRHLCWWEAVKTWQWSRGQHRDRPYLRAHQWWWIRCQAVLRGRAELHRWMVTYDRTPRLTDTKPWHNSRLAVPSVSDCQPLVAEHFQLPLHESGTLYQISSSQQQTCLSETVLFWTVVFIVCTLLTN